MARGERNVAGMGSGTVDVEVWLVGLDLPTELVERLSAALDPEERANVAAQRPSAARRYAVAHGAQREILGCRLGRDPAALRIDRACATCGRPHGQPVLPEHPEVVVSLSHSDGLALLAVATGARVGVDLEVVRARPRLERLAERVLTPEEHDVWASAPPEHRLPAFLAAWTAKEAFLKALGEGIRRPLASVPARLPEGWSSATPHAGEGRVTCLAVEAPLIAVREHVFDPAGAR